MNGLPERLGRMMASFFPVRLNVILRNLRQVYGSRLDAKRTREIVEGFYAHFLRSLWEWFAMKFWPDEKIRNMITVKGEEHVLKAAELNRGVIFLTGHFGSWEFAPAAAIRHWQQYKGRFHFIRKKLHPKILEKAIFGSFYSAGIGVIPKRGSLDQILDTLGRNEAVVFLMDLHTSLKPKDGIPVPFFGRQAGTSRSLAVIAATTGAPVLPATSWREPDGHHVMEFFAPLDWIRKDDADEELLANTRRYNEVLEQFVLAHPEQWWWFHRRWKL